MCRHCGVNYAKDEPVSLDGWYVDPLMNLVFFRDKQVHVSIQQMLYLHSIMRAGKEGMRKEALFNRVADEDTEIKIVDVQVCKLRKNMSIADPEHSYIKTVWGIGYVWFKEPCIRHSTFQAPPSVIPEIETVVAKKARLLDPRWERRRRARRLQRLRS